MACLHSCRRHGDPQGAEQRNPAPDTGCPVAFTPGIDYDIQLAGGLRSMLFGGEGLLLTTLKGTGSV